METGKLMDMVEVFEGLEDWPNNPVTDVVPAGGRRKLRVSGFGLAGLVGAWRGGLRARSARAREPVRL